MLCEKCGKYNATTHIRQIKNGVAIEKNLCSHCAALDELNTTPKNALDIMLASILGEMGYTDKEATKICPVCGADYSYIAESGKAGCADCYKTFRTELLPYIKRVHGSIKHIGKTPGTISHISDLEGLKLELKRLISEENYEQAAVIRDKIKRAEAEKNE